MHEIHEYTDLWAVIVGLMGSLMKGIKKRLGVVTTLTGMVVAGILAYGTIGVIDQFFGHLNERIVIVISFAVGWGANEITDYLDDTVKAVAERYIKKLSKSEPKNEVENEDKKEVKKEQ